MKIARLTTDDVLRGEDQVLIHLGDPPTSVPQPFAGVLLDYLGNRSNMTIATNMPVAVQPWPAQHRCPHRHDLSATP
ncbi:MULTISPECIES: hypothetical protein [Saccharomonospora]|uniref:hypothetical protein n=1 Tax=Saccharomonospora TaxID=1851 RepID=UPI0012F7ECC6|nr:MULTISPECIES: hypothetical protein [Saccharomonospora]